MSFFHFFRRNKTVSSSVEGATKSALDPVAGGSSPLTAQDIKNSIFLPQTDFPMKANLPTREPKILAEWQQKGLYRRLRKRSKGRPQFILHYGPPYANGACHTGHALSEGLKDIVVKFAQMSGRDAPLIPGWDCHGLPIEWKVEENFRQQKKNKDDIPVLDFLAECRQFAAHWIQVQSEGLQRLGICADWEHPYKTMDAASEATIVEQFLKIFMAGYIYQGKKPVLWSVVEKTALAEAEVEYKDLESTAVYVAFPVVDSPLPVLQESSVVIWTTTPWTLPANRAIAYHDDMDYVLIEVKQTREDAEESLKARTKLLVSADLLPTFCEAVGITDYAIVAKMKGADLKGTLCQHPFDLCQQQTEKDRMSPLAYTFAVPLIHAVHVTTEVGTGFVHTAPSHGLEDFVAGLQNHLPMPDLVQEDGTYVEALPLLGGKHVFKVDDEVVTLLRRGRTLLATNKIEHSYPHSWRSKSPLIFRLTSQWFLDINKARPQALEAIQKVRWVPAQGQRRIQSMVETRPDWCLSRQRLWGTPITLFVHKDTKEPLRDEKVNAKIIEKISQEGIEGWFKADVTDFLPAGLASQYEKVTDTLDVWFDSACTHAFVLQKREDVAWPADLYLEGSDQHRGWFQSSLIESVVTTGQAPYKAVLTHGFLLDQKGYKMSKSLGNTITCEEIIQRHGADLLRLWIASVDYSEDVRLGPDILKRQEDIYRRFRNTLRYLLGALGDFKLEKNVAYKDLPELEQLMLHKLVVLHEKRQAFLKDFNFAEFYSELHTFCSNDLSAFYFDIRKDSLYCDALDDFKRRSAQTVMNLICHYLMCWLAPVLSFTAEEAWQVYPFKTTESIHEQLFPTPEEAWKRPDLEERWQKIRAIRRVVTCALEQERLAKTINSSLQASVVLYASKETAAFLKGVDMAELAIISNFTLLTAQPQAGAVTLEECPGIGVVVTPATGHKCLRCWKVVEVVNEAGVCTRCESVLKTLCENKR